MNGAMSAWYSSLNALFPNMDVAENIGYGLKIRGVSRAGAQRMS